MSATSFLVTTRADQLTTLVGMTVPRTYTFPDATATMARTDAANTFAGIQTFNTQINNTLGANSTSQTTGGIIGGGLGLSGDIFCRDVTLAAGRILALRTGLSISSPSANVIRLTSTTALELGTSGPRWVTGTGTPEGAVTAPVGSFFSRTDGGANTTFYVKESGSGNTGWIAK